MSFLGGGAGGAAGGLGHLLGADPSRISSIADRIGNGANMIANAGGAPSGYAAPQQQSQDAPGVNNYMQLLDPNILKALIAKVGGGGGGAPGYAGYGR